MPSGLESELSVQTEKPREEVFETKYGLRPPGQLSKWLSKEQSSINAEDKAVKSAFKRNSQPNAPTFLYGINGQLDELDYQNYRNKKIAALQVLTSLIDILY